MVYVITSSDSLIERAQSCRKWVHSRIDTAGPKIIAKGSGDLPGECLLAIDRRVTIQKILLDSIVSDLAQQIYQSYPKLFQARFDLAGRNTRLVVIDECVVWRLFVSPKIRLLTRKIDDFFQMRFKHGEFRFRPRLNPGFSSERPRLLKFFDQRNRNFGRAIVGSPPFADICAFLRLWLEAGLFSRLEPIAHGKLGKKRVCF